MSEFFYGWDLLYRTIDHVVNKKGDLLIALTHFLLTKHNNFRCVGVGDSKTMPTDNDAGTELLPDNWNDDDINYSLRYVCDGKLYLILGHLTDENSLVINLLDISTKKVSNILLEPETLVVATSGTINTLMPQASEIIDRLRNELLDPVFLGDTREVSTQTNINQDYYDPFNFGTPRCPRSFTSFLFS